MKLLPPTGLIDGGVLSSFGLYEECINIRSTFDKKWQNIKSDHMPDQICSWSILSG